MLRNNQVKQLLKDDGVYIECKAFVRSKLKYENFIYWSVAEIPLAKLDCVQQRLLEGVDVSSLEQRREAMDIGLMSGNLKQLLKPLTPKVRNPSEDQLRRSIRLKGPIQQREQQLKDQATTRSMEVLKRSYRG